MPEDLRDEIAVLPALDPLLGTLPPRARPYRVTFADVHQLFVAEAPFRERRQRLYDALVLHAECVWEVLPEAKIWVDGGFLTHKTWAEPEDVDVVIVVATASPEAKAQLASQGLLTLKDVQSTANDRVLPKLTKLRAFGGLVDAYLATGARAELYQALWSKVRGPDGSDTGTTKGFVEVIRGY
ncbi:hypothetical protein HQQ80_02000 [Microbacteriaceae bacterium VKM Ac-2855]|nr:hypothetical protein [Microbacteriaceae bacterium VKM Ac-2855]